MQQPYDADFFTRQQDGSMRAARVVAPIVLAAFPARSVIDVGCGVGTWLRAMRDAGIHEIDGYDGDYVDRALLRIDAGRFHPADLREKLPVSRRYDLAMSLEVAEHLPRECAAGFVADLTRAAPVVLFSAAIPGQGGISHVNERWQDYWRAAFAEHDYRPVDLVRPAIRGNPDVPFWYQQNTIIYCDAETLRNRPDLASVPDHVSLNLVHKVLYENTIDGARMWLTKAVRMLPGLALTAARNRLGMAAAREESR